MRLADLVTACREETSRFLRREPARDAFCWEITRRAVCERDQTAWQALVEQYRGLVLLWVRQHPAAAMIDEDDDHWVNRAFERFWGSVGPERFGHFAGLPQLLQYLKLCAHSTLMDEARARRRHRAESLSDEALAGERALTDEAPDAEALAIEQVTAGDLWQAVAAETTGEAERLVAYLTFVQHLKPREIHARHPEHFAAVADVYRVTHNLKERLRRSPRIRRFLVA